MQPLSAQVVVGGVVLRFTVVDGRACHIRCTEGPKQTEIYNLPSQRKLAAQWIEAKIEGEVDRSAAYATLDLFERLAAIVREGSRV